LRALAHAGLIADKGRQSHSSERGSDHPWLPPEGPPARVFLNNFRFVPTSSLLKRARPRARILLDENGEVSAAVVRYTEILRAEPDNISARYKLAWCLALLGRSSEAQQHYAEALRLQPDFGEAHEQLAIELAKSGKQTEALEHFWQAVRLQPASPSAHKDLGIALARQQKFEEAAKQFEEALGLDPADATAQKLLQAARHSAGSGK